MQGLRVTNYTNPPFNTLIDLITIFFNMNHVMMILAGDGQEMTAKIYLAVIILGMMLPGFMIVMRFV